MILSNNIHIPHIIAKVILRFVLQNSYKVLIRGKENSDLLKVLLKTSFASMQTSKQKKNKIINLK